MEGNKLSQFQIIMFTVLIIIILIAVALFAFKRIEDRALAIAVTMWGTVEPELIAQIQIELNDIKKNTLNINYVQKKPETFEIDIIESLASNNAPDIFLIPSDILLKQRNKFFLIPYKYYSQRDFKNNFLESSEILLLRDGLHGLPFSVDPLIMYWNRGKLNSAGISAPPAFWDEFTDLIPKLTVKDPNLNIQDAGVAFGEFTNINNAKEIFLTLLMQAGNPIVSLNITQENKEVYISSLGERFGYTIRPAEAALNFYTQFSNANKNVYSWNRSLPNSDTMFLSNDLAFYFGFASEYKTFLQKNPNLNIDVALMPQSQTGNFKTTLAKLNVLAISRSTKNFNKAFNAINILSSGPAQSILAKYTQLPPVRRELLSDQQNNSFIDIFYKSAIISKTFLDPDSISTTNIISDMIESYTSGRATQAESVDRASQQFINLLK
jgi:ABC-type glycerol-3-phosphate transport system substrate-binding protein